ncbi:MAG TPA: hypothetical protein VFX25_20730, partial [Streptosporangiaceae bacterium]|nr:hypothetical protein [Streptosporangiaceae bacterium]
SRQRGAGAPSPAAPSGGWPQPDAQAAWPDSGPPTAWSTDQPARPAGWTGPGDSLEPLPSADVHHGGPAGTAPGDRSRRRWPAPDSDEDERDAW